MTKKFPAVGEVFEQRYELLEVLGTGGGGTVFKARQTGADRLIALKVLQPEVIDEDFKQRFLREAQALSKLNHANIVTVYHLGLSDDAIPYLAMELIDGLSLRKAKLNCERLSARRTLRIMKQLCSALEYMHENGIVHRDLKPENIMLLSIPEADTVKVIDFGLVKVDGASNQALTATGLLIGTVNYMSPEQCMGKKADARSDIYSIAICMYEMLAGEPPFTSDNPVGLMYKHINLKAPEIRLQTGKLLHPAIQEFIGKGLEKNPNLRFQTATEMSTALLKLDEYLGEEIAPHASSPKASVQQLAIALALLCTLTICAAIFMRQQDKSPIQEKRKLAASYSSAKERALESAVARSEKSYGTDSIEMAKRLDQLVDLYVKQQQYAKAEPLLKRALQIYEKTRGRESPELDQGSLYLGDIYKKQGKYREAEQQFKHLLQTREKAFGPESHAVIRCLMELGAISMEQNKHAEAEPLLKRALQISEKTFGQKSTDVGLVLPALANCYTDQKRYAEAEPLLKRSLKIYENADGQESFGVSECSLSLGELYKNQRKYAEAEPLLQRSLKIREKVLAPESLEIATGLFCLGDLYREQKKYAEAESFFKRSLQIREKVFGPESPEFAAGLFVVANCYREEKKFEKAVPLYQRSIQIREKALGPQSPDLASALVMKAVCYREQKKYTEAEPLLRRSLHMYEKVRGLESQEVANDLLHLAILHREQEHFAEAEPLYKRSLQLIEKVASPQPLEIARTLDEYAILLHQTNRPAEAAKMEARAQTLRASKK